MRIIDLSEATAQQLVADRHIDCSHELFVYCRACIDIEQSILCELNLVECMNGTKIQKFIDECIS